MAVGILSRLVLASTIDPSAGPGYAAAIGTLLERDNAGIGELWRKTGPADVSWSKLDVASAVRISGDFGSAPGIAIGAGPGDYPLGVGAWDTCTIDTDGYTGAIVPPLDDASTNGGNYNGNGRLVAPKTGVYAYAGHAKFGPAAAGRLVTFLSLGSAGQSLPYHSIVFDRPADVNAAAQDLTLIGQCYLYAGDALWLVYSNALANPAGTLYGVDFSLRRVG